MFYYSKPSAFYNRFSWLFSFTTGEDAYGPYTLIDWEITLFGFTFIKFK